MRRQPMDHPINHAMAKWLKQFDKPTLWKMLRAHLREGLVDLASRAMEVTGLDRKQLRACRHDNIRVILQELQRRKDLESN